MQIRRAKSLKYLGSSRRYNGFRHFYQVDGRQLSFFTSVGPLGLSEPSSRIAAAHAALANLIDIYSITLPREVVIEGISLNRQALAFWERTARNIAAERIVEDNLPANVLNARWRSESSLQGRLERMPKAKKRGLLLAMSGGKESLTALKIMPDASACSLFFLHYPDRGWRHGQQVLNFFRRSHECIKVRNDITGTTPLITDFNCKGYGMFVIGQIVFSALFVMDRFSVISIGNEFSANFGNGIHDGVPVNHQYDKSFSFAQELNNYLAAHVTEDFTHASPFWQWHEYRIAHRFFSDNVYLQQWSSCNHSSSAGFFCGRCAKCAFVFLLGAAHTDPSKICRMMGVNLMDNLNLIRALADPEGRKPLECVGTKEEVWVALEDIWQKNVWRDSPGLQYYGDSIRPGISSRLTAMRKNLMKTKSLRPFMGTPPCCE